MQTGLLTCRTVRQLHVRIGPSGLHGTSVQNRAVVEDGVKHEDACTVLAVPAVKAKPSSLSNVTPPNAPSLNNGPTLTSAANRVETAHKQDIEHVTDPTVTGQL